MFETDRRHFLSLLGAAALVPALPVAAEAFTGAAIIADARLLNRVWTTLHPGLLRYNSAADIADRFAAFERWAAPGRSLPETFLAFGRLTAALRCGHSYPNPVNQRRALRTALFEKRDRVPFAFTWIEGRMIVTRAFAGAPVAPGTEILAIDGEPAARLLARLMPLARADGANDAKRIANIEVTGLDRYAAFDVYRGLLMPTSVDELRLQARAPGGAARELVVAAMTEAERAGDRPSEEGDAALWTIERRGDGVAVLRMPTWAVYNSRWDWQGFLARELDRLASEGARGLVIDLRGNEGGLDCGDAILARLIDHDLRAPAYARRTRYRRAPADLVPLLDTWDKSFLDWGEAAVGPDAAGFYRLAADDDARDLIRPAGQRLRAPVVVLVDAACSSATFQFAQLVKESGVATLVGMPTGGNQRGINGGVFFFTRLPATGIEIDVPLIAYMPDRPRPDAGIAPDIRIPPSVAAIAAGEDRGLAAAVALCLSGGGEAIRPAAPAARRRGGGA